MTYASSGGRGHPKSLIASDLRPLFLILYIHCIIMQIYHLIGQSTYLFVIYLFIYFGFLISQSLIYNLFIYI